MNYLIRCNFLSLIKIMIVNSMTIILDIVHILITKQF